MNFKKVLLALAASGALLLTSCQESEGPLPIVDITVSSEYLEIPEEGASTSVTVTSNYAWTGEVVVSNPWGDEDSLFHENPWITVEPLSGEAGDTVEVNISVVKNTSDSVLYQREVIIYFRSEHQVYAATTVHQLGGVLKPNADTGPKPVTVAEFLAAEETNQWYRLSGKVVDLYNTEYGNFDIVDETGSVLCYGLNLNATAGDKTFSQIGIGEGDYVTLIGRRSSYNGEPQVGDAYYAPIKVTVAEFLAAEIDEDGQLYEITGTMKGLSNETYGNFDITDETGSVYVYGLTSTPILGQSNDKSFSQTGYAEGDKLTIVGTRGDYNGKAEVMGPAYPVRLKTGGSEPEPEPEPQPELTKATVAEVLAAEVSDDVWYELTGTITEIQNAEYGNIVIEDETGSILVYGLTKEWNGGSNDKSFSEIEGLTAGDIVTLGGTRDEYDGEPQVGGTAFYISHVDYTTIEEFLEAPVNDETWYTVRGTIFVIEKSKSTGEESTYGNIWIKDETGILYVYGLTTTQQDSNDQSFPELGLKLGDVVVLRTLRAEYDGEPQGGGTIPAYYISHSPAEDNPEDDILISDDPAQNWLELPEVETADDEVFTFHHTETDGVRVRNYSMLYNTTERLALWVAYPLCDIYTASGNRTDAWGFDPKIPDAWEPIIPDSWGVNGYARGHQIPSAARNANKEMNRQTFYFTNMTAQDYDFNSGLWADVEELERDAASQFDTLYVVTGPILDADGDGYWEYFQDNAGNSVAVPEAYFRVLLGVQADEYNAIGFFYLNGDNGHTRPQESDLRTVAEIEEKTGITFFKNLPPERAAEVKSQRNPELWGL